MLGEEDILSRAQELSEPVFLNRASLITVSRPLQYGSACRFSKLRPWKPQNSQFSMDFEGSEAGIVKFQRKMKVPGALAGRRRDSLSPGLNNRPAGLKYIGKRKVLAPRGPVPDPQDLCPLPGPSSRTLPAWFPGPHPSPGNLLAQPTA